MTATVTGPATSTPQLDAFLREFTFLSNHFDFNWKKPITHRVSRINSSILDVCAIGEYPKGLYIGQRYVTDPDETIVLFDKNGSRIGDVGRAVITKEIDVTTGFWWDRKTHVKTVKETTYFMESIWDCLKRLGDAVNEVHYIVRTNFRNQYSHKPTIVVYKAPKGMSIMEFMDSEIKEATLAVATEIMEIDGNKPCCKCHYALPQEANFCSSCGHPQK
ncbi:MAG: zinc ribbon domain-containing protein [Patescibacteria group bacterium]